MLAIHQYYSSADFEIKIQKLRISAAMRIFFPMERQELFHSVKMGVVTTCQAKLTILVYETNKKLLLLDFFYFSSLITTAENQMMLT
jgi:hypothetical protein